MGFRDLWRRGEPKAKDPGEVIEQVQQLRRLGRLEDARAQVAEALAAAGDHAQMNKLYWDLCVQLDRPADAAPQLLRAIRAQLRAGAGEEAVFAWFELGERVETPPIEPDLRWRLAEAMLAGGHDEAASALLESAHEGLDPALPSATLLRLALAAAKSRSPSAEPLTTTVLSRPGVPESMRAQLEQALAAARATGLRRPAGEVQDDGPIEVAKLDVADRRLKVVAALPRAVDGERLTLELPGGVRRGLAVRQIQALAAARIDEGTGEAYVIIDLLLDSLWSDLEELRTVRLRSRDFDPQNLVPEAGDSQLALGTFLSNLLASSGAQPLPDADATVGRPFHAFASVAEYQRRIFEIA